MSRSIKRAQRCMLLLAALGVAACDSGSSDEAAPLEPFDNTRMNAWATAAAARVASAPADDTQRGAARNVILFVGDGMGLTTETAARILAGQQLGGNGEDHVLSFEAMPFAGFSRTYNVDAQTPDSAGTMTAMMTGVKTDVGVLGVAEGVERGECGSVAGNELITALQLAELAGMATGIVTTARLTHATPAGTYAVSADRNWEDVSDMPADAVAAGCEDIASQFVNAEARLEARYPGHQVDGFEIAMGGGRRHFLPADPAFNSPDAFSDVEGDRTDGRDLISEWRALYPNGSVALDQAGFDSFDPESGERLLALFNESHMQYSDIRPLDVAGEPSLSQMTDKAIRRLDNDPDGYFLMVEAGRIDHAHHANNARGALLDTIALADAVAVAQSMASADTLIIVTADHGHVFTIAGYPQRGNPILGKVVTPGSTEPTLAEDGLPYTTLGYQNGLGFRDFGPSSDPDQAYSQPANAGRFDLSLVDTTQAGFHQEVLVPLPAETHSGEDVAIHAQGPGASLVRGTNEQHMIFHVMERAADLVGRADAALSASGGG